MGSRSLSYEANCEPRLLGYIKKESSEICTYSILYCIVFIHFYSASHSITLSEELPITAIYTESEFTREALQATVSEGLVHGPYVAARAEFEPTTYRLKGIVSTNAPPRPTMRMLQYACMHANLFS